VKDEKVGKWSLPIKAL